MKNITILGRKCDTLLLVASVGLLMFIISLTLSDCNGTSGKCNKKEKGSCNGKEKGCCNGNKNAEPVGGANIIGANDGTFSELADV